MTAESIGTLNAAGNVYGTALIETGVTLNGVVLTESATGPGADNVVSTQADVFGDQALSTYWDGNTLAIQSDGKAARSGVLVGKIGEVFYYAKNGVWHNADGSVYQVDDGTGTMKDVALTTDAATGYGLGATATVYSTAKNVDTNGNPIDRLYALKEEGSEIFQSGTYAFNYIPVSAEIPALTVSTDQDVENMYDGVISLREALKYAQEDAAALKAGTITVSAFAGNGFDAATGTYTIKFIDTVLQIDLDSTLGTLVLANNALGTYSLTIDGAIASGKVVVDGGDKYDGTTVTEHSGVRIMSIGSGNTVTLQNLTLQKGFVSGGNGGAILNSGSLTLQSVSLLNNANMSDTAITWGGAVYNSGTLVVEDSLFSGNATYKKNSAFAHGAAISNKGTLTISGTTFEGNISAQDAGAIYNENGKLTITGSEFLNNKAASNGSAIYVLNGSLDVSDSSFSGNTGNNVIYNGGKPVTIDSSVFTGNGGTVLVNFTGTLYVLNSTFLNNTGNIAIKGQGSANVGSSYTVVLNSTIIGQTGIGVQGYAAGGTVFIGNSIIAGSTQNDIVSQGAPVAVVGSIYDKTSVNTEANANLKDLGGNYVISEHLADGETVYQHLFGTDTPALNSANVLMPTLEKAVSGGIVFRVEPDANSVNMLQYNDGTGWKNVQKYSGVTDGNFVWEDQTAATLLTQAQVAVDQVGNSRLNKATYSVGAVDLQSLTVTTTEDVIDAADGKTSLREAITNAINLGGGTVTFSKNVDWAADTTITVGSTILVNEDLAGDIVIDGSYTYKVTENDVEVAKTGKVNLNASALTERTVILVDTDSTSAASFTFKNMTLTGGADVTEEDGFGQKGAAFWADKLNLTLDGVTVTAYRQLIGSGASNDFGLAGGAVALDNGTLTILNSTLTNNTTTKPGGGWRAGGAVLVGVNGSLVVDQSTFEGNSVVAPNNGGAGGGAIMMEKGVGDATITDSIFKNNSANAYGGAIFVSGPDRTVTISGSQFTGNSAVKGGGALHSGVKLNVSDTVFRQNTAADGGAVVLAAGVSDFSDVRFEQNSATAAGGAIYNKASGSDMTIVNSDFVNNTAVTKGGAIYNNRHFFIDRSSFIGNTVTGTDANGAGTGAGGAIYVFNHSGLGFVTNSTFYNNSATGTGGAIHFEASGNHTVVPLVNVTIAGNHAGVEGGGVYLYLWSGLTNKMAITNSIVLGNTATAEKAFNDWTVLWSTSTVDNGNSSGRLLNSVIGSVKVLGVKGSGIVTDGVKCYNPLYDRNGSSVIGEVYNLSGSADGITDVTLTSSAAYLVNNAKLTNSEYTVAEMVAEVFGSKIMLNRDGRTLRTLNSDLVLGGVKTAVQKFNTVSGGYNISTSFFDGAKWVKVENGATESDANINDTAQYQILDVDQNGKSREVTVNGTAYQVRGAMSGLADDTPLVVETLEGGFDAYDGKTSLREAIDYANENGGPPESGR